MIREKVITGIRAAVVVALVVFFVFAFRWLVNNMLGQIYVDTQSADFSNLPAANLGRRDTLLLGGEVSLLTGESDVYFEIKGVSLVNSNVSLTPSNPVIGDDGKLKYRLRAENLPAGLYQVTLGRVQLKTVSAPSLVHVQTTRMGAANGIVMLLVLLLGGIEFMVYYFVNWILSHFE